MSKSREIHSNLEKAVTHLEVALKAMQQAIQETSHEVNSDQLESQKRELEALEGLLFIGATMANKECARWDELATVKEWGHFQ